MEVAQVGPDATQNVQEPLPDLQPELTCCPAHLIHKSHVSGPLSAQDSIPALVHVKKIETAIGRERNSVDVHLDSTRVPRMISRVHSFLVYSHHQWKVRDNRSVNGVFVNDRKVHEAVLQDGDMVVFGGGGNRPIGAVFEQRDSEFKYEFRANHFWNMPTSSADDSSEDVTDGESDTRPSTDDIPLFEMDASDNQELPQEGLEASKSPLVGVHRVSNQKKRKRASSSAQPESSTVETLPMDETDDASAISLVQTIEWAGPQAKKFCPPEVGTDRDASNTPLVDMEELQMERGVTGSRPPTEANPEAKMGTDGAEPEDGEAKDGIPMSFSLEVRISDPKLRQKIETLQEALAMAARERKLIDPIHAFPDSSPLQCKHCKNLIFNPIQIGCGHSLCDGCVESIVIEDPPECPVCQQEITGPMESDLTMQAAVLLVVSSWTQDQRHEWVSKMTKRNEAFRKAGLELLLESFKAQGYRFLSIEERWSDSNRLTFTTGVELYNGSARGSFCAAVGLSPEWISKADFDLLLLALGNVGLSIAPLVIRARAHPALIAGSKSLQELILDSFREALTQFTSHNRRQYHQLQQQLHQQQLQQMQQFLRQFGQQHVPGQDPNPHAGAADP